jgi:hypothetical protein
VGTLQNFKRFYTLFTVVTDKRSNSLAKNVKAIRYLQAVLPWTRKATLSDSGKSLQHFWVY